MSPIDLACSLTGILSERESLSLYRSKKMNHPSLLQVSVNMPGQDKNADPAPYLFRQCIQCLEARGRRVFGFIGDFEIRSGALGKVGLVSSKLNGLELKNTLLEFEQQERLASYWDLDVFDYDGRSLSRRSLGVPERKCWICSEPAKACSAEMRHSTSTLLKKMQSDAVSELRRNSQMI